MLFLIFCPILGQNHSDSLISRHYHILGKTPISQESFWEKIPGKSVIGAWKGISCSVFYLLQRSSPEHVDVGEQHH